MLFKNRMAAPALAFAAFFAAAVGPLAAASVQAEGAAGAGSLSVEAFDPQATAAWYRDRLGFRILADRNTVQGRHVVLERQGMLLELTETEPRAPAADVETTGSTGLPALSVLVGDVDAEVERLARAGVAILALPDDSLDGRIRTAALRDPEGRTVELREPLAGRTGEAP